MDSLVSEMITLWFTPSGVPERMVWDGRRFLVTTRPILWLDRTRWWQQIGPVKKEDSGSIDVPVWRFEITPVDGESESQLVDVAERDGRWVLCAVVEPVSK